MPPQILRLVLLTLVIVSSYGVLRVFLTPKSFGQYGHYRGAALAERAALDPVFAGAKACAECHDDIITVQDKGTHRHISCETCHGPALAHTHNPDLKLVAIPPARCLRCHLSDPARPAAQKQIVPEDHYGDNCLECHLPHNPKESPP